MIKKNVKTKLQEYFFIHPTQKLRLRQIEKNTKLSFPLVSKYTKELVEENILKINEISGVMFYSANRASKDYLIEKKIYNLKEIIYSGLIDYIIHELSNPPIILFGSYAKGEDIENSDIDIYIETISKKNINIAKFEKKLQRKVQIFRKTSITNIKNTHLANNIINGISLNKNIEVFKDG
ncbi:MAG: nucleotidyltransferase family protein [Nanoarchaeota archaeon]